MRGWYNIHDHTNKRIGFYPLDESVKSFPTKALTKPTEELPYVELPFTEYEEDTILGLERTTFIIVAVSVSVVIAGSVAILVIFCFF